MSDVICNLCQDTHIMPATGYMCTRCPAPCQQCRMNGYGAFCQNTPCSCKCHDKQYIELMEWYTDPLTKEHIAELRKKLATTRGLLTCMINWESDDKSLVPSTEDIVNALKETTD